MPAADAETRFRERLRALEADGATGEELEKAAPSIAAEVFGPGPWSDEGPGFISPSDTPPLPRPPEKPPESGESLLGAGVRNLGEAAEFARGGVNSFLNRQVDSVSLGALGPEAMLERAKANYFDKQRMAQSGLMTSPNAVNQAKRDYEAALQASKDAQDHKIAGVAGSISGGLMSPGGKLARGITDLPMAAKGMAAAAKGGIAGGAGAALDAGGRALIEGKSLGQAGEDAGLAGTLGGILGTALPLYGAVLRDPRALTGEYVQALERGRGFLNSAENAALKKDGPRAIGQLADIEGEKLGAMQVAKREGALERIASAEENLPTAMNEPIDVTGVHNRLDQAVRRYSNQRPAMPGVEKTIEEDIKPNLSRVTAQEIKPVMSKPQSSGMVGPDGKPLPAQPGKVTGFEPGEEISSPQATPADLLMQRRMARKQSQPGMPETPENAPYREIYGHLQDATHDPALPDNIGPRLAASDADFSRDMAKLAEGNELILGKDNARAVTDSLAAKRAAAGRLTQGLKDTQAGGAQLRNLEKIRELGPEYAESVDRVMAKIAEQGSKFGLPRVFSHTGKWPYQLYEQNAMAFNTKLAEPLTRTPEVASGAGAGLVPTLRDPVDALLNRKKPEKREGR